MDKFFNSNLSRSNFMKSEEFSILSNQQNLHQFSRNQRGIESDNKIYFINKTERSNIYEDYYSNNYLKNNKKKKDSDIIEYYQNSNSIPKSKFFYNTRNSENNNGKNSRLQKFKAERQRRNKIFHTRSVSQNVSKTKTRNGSKEKEFNETKSKTFDNEKLKNFLKKFNSQPKSKTAKESSSNIVDAIDLSIKMIEGNYKQNIEFLQVKLFNP